MNMIVAIQRIVTWLPVDKLKFRARAEIDLDIVNTPPPGHCRGHQEYTRGR